VSAEEYQDLSTVSISVEGGVPPLTFSVTGGSLPSGVQLRGASTQLAGSPTSLGSYHANFTIQDSFSPPQTSTGQITINVSPIPLGIAQSLPPTLLLNRAFNGRVIATGAAFLLITFPAVHGRSCRLESIQWIRAATSVVLPPWLETIC